MEERKTTMSRLRSELSKIPIISKNSLKVKETMDRNSSPSQPSSRTKASLDGEEFTGLELKKIKKASLFD